MVRESEPAEFLFCSLQNYCSELIFLIVLSFSSSNFKPKEKPEGSLECNFIVIHMWEKPLYVNTVSLIWSSIIVPLFSSLSIHPSFPGRRSDSSNKTPSFFKMLPYYNATGVMEVPYTLSALITVFSGFCLRRCFVSPGPLQSLHGESADVCGQQRGRVCPAGAENAGAVPAGYLCWQHLWAQWVYLYIY